MSLQTRSLEGRLLYRLDTRMPHVCSLSFQPHISGKSFLAILHSQYTVGFSLLIFLFKLRYQRIAVPARDSFSRALLHDPKVTVPEFE